MGEKPRIEPRIFRGMRDFLPAVARRRNDAVAALRRVFESFGFEPLDTPAVEMLDVLMGKYGEDADRLIFKLARHGDDADAAALRYDLTVPLARVVAMHQAEFALPWKRWQVAPVWRAERPQKGRFREFLQCDVDIVGAPAPAADAEVLAVAAAAYRTLGFADVVLRLNHRGIVRAVIEKAGADEHGAGFLLRTLDKEDKIGLEGVLAALREGEAREGHEPIRLPAGAVDVVRDLLELRKVGAPADVLAGLERVLSPAPSAGPALAEMRILVRALAESGAAGTFAVDPGLVRGLDYYTGPIFEAVVPGGGVGSVGGGGRYDGLVGSMLGREVPAVGFSIGLERLLVLVAEREEAAAAAGGAVFASAPADVLVAVFSPDLLGDALKLAGEVRAAGLRAEVFPGEAGKLKKQFAWADKRGVPLVALVGPDEMAKGVVALKTMKTGESRPVARAQIVPAIRTSLGTTAQRV